MKKITFLVFASILMYPNADAQVVYNETFDNYTLGNLGTDPSGKVPGQSGWYTEMLQPANNNYATITAETNKGKVLTLASAATAPYKCFLYAKRPDMATFIDQRSAGNNVLKFEIDYYTGAQHGKGNSSAHQQFGLYHYNPALLNNPLVKFSFQATTGDVSAQCQGQSKIIYLDNNPNNLPNHRPTMPFNTWVTFIVYLDYNNKKAYFETPYFNAVTIADFLTSSSSTNLIEDFKPSQLMFIFSSDVNTAQVFNKYNNIKITALKSVPPNVVSSPTFLSKKFNLYPNPATEIVNISNNEQMKVKEVEIYDTAGKLIGTQTFNDQTEIKLNISALNSGTYLLHLKTNEGIAVKKLVKN